MLTQAKLKSRLTYDKETGAFAWKDSGRIAGGVNSHGYHRIKINGKAHLSHRLAWLYVHGEWPAKQIDHINRNKLDNRIGNLRDVNQSVNQHNVGPRKFNTSGVKGVTYRARDNRWVVTMRRTDASRYIGTYKTFLAACYARHSAEVHRER